MILLHPLSILGSCTYEHSIQGDTLTLVVVDVRLHSIRAGNIQAQVSVKRERAAGVSIQSCRIFHYSSQTFEAMRFKYAWVSSESMSDLCEKLLFGQKSTYIAIVSIVWFG